MHPTPVPGPPDPPLTLTKVPKAFFDRDTARVARELLGRWMVRRVEGSLRIGRIVETEAYLGPHDRASHSSKGRTPRNRSMFGPPRCSRCGGDDCAQVLDPDAPVITSEGWRVYTLGQDGERIDVTTFADPYPWPIKSIGEPTLDNCPACRGTGEISEFPADDDERLVACPTCGGTGEVYE